MVNNSLLFKDLNSLLQESSQQRHVFSRPINDLDDVRTAMSSLKDIREAEIRIDMTIGPVEESYALLNRFELHYDDGNSERVDGLAYQWRNLMAQVGAVCWRNLCGTVS